MSTTSRSNDLLNRIRYYHEWVSSLPVWVLIAVFFGPALLFPVFYVNGLTTWQFLNTMTFMFLFIGLGHGWNVIGGYAGQISLGHAIMFAFGAYTTGILLINYGITPWIGIIIGGFVAVAAGLALGGITFQLRYHYFAIATLAAALAMESLFNRWDFVGASVGLRFTGIQASTSNFIFRPRWIHFYVMWAFAFLVTVLIYRLHTAKLGLYLKAINEDQELAANAGLNIFQYKMYAMGISSFIVGVGGGLYAMYVTFLSPVETLDLIRNVEILLIPIIGGLGTVFGPIIGGVLYMPTREYTRGMFAGSFAGLDWVLFGFILLFIALYAPSGIINKLRSLQKKAKQNDE